MNIKPNDTVYLKHSSDKAVVLELIDSETALVQTDDGVSFPVYLSEIYKTPQIQHEIEKEIQFVEAIKCKSAPKHKQLYVAWNFLYDTDQLILEPFLINGDTTLLNISWKIINKHETYTEINTSIRPHYYIKGNRIPERLIDNNWKIIISGNEVFSDMSSAPYEVIERLKPAIFTHDLVMDESLGKRVITQKLKVKKSYKKLDREKLKNYADSLRLKTNQNQTDQKKIYRKINLGDLHEFASFDNVLDLHLESIVENPQTFSASEAIAFQLKVLDEYLFQAIRIGVDNVFIIHGIGKGVLKNEISKKLKRHPAVRTFRNDHHPKYGFGATEIFFK